eukprot:TRINITY_DN18052_c0_g1_i2.p1 TRINITY_DN18052_c0_g1~~TRINITY_DN18052_c0_g1_i2.p1  ORF type:complete len:365 (+),score=57.45 TRINITY_DN18052_c0_g1_i2:33-1127(+)
MEEEDEDSGLRTRGSSSLSFEEEVSGISQASWLKQQLEAEESIAYETHEDFRLHCGSSLDRWTPMCWAGSDRRACSSTPIRARSRTFSDHVATPDVSFLPQHAANRASPRQPKAATPRSRLQAQMSIYPALPSAVGSTQSSLMATTSTGRSSACSPRSSRHGMSRDTARATFSDDLLRLTIRAPAGRSFGILASRSTRVGPERAEARAEAAFEEEWGEILADHESQEGAKSLKELVEAATGIPIRQQKLTYGLRGPLEKDHYAVSDYDMDNGSVISLTIKPGGSRHEPPRRGPWVCKGEADLGEHAWQVTGALPKWDVSTTLQRKTAAQLDDLGPMKPVKFPGKLKPVNKRAQHRVSVHVATSH